MYQAHFGLKEMPFGITPDTSYFFACASYQEALNTLLIAAKNGEGFIKITGEVGTGKTLLCRKFLSTLGNGWITAYIPNPYLEPQALLLALAEELHVPFEKNIDQHHLLKALTRTLLDYAKQNKRVVICLDEVQAMPTESLEALRLLTNLETEKRKLLQVVLFGQPELDKKLAEESVRQLRQRITFHYHLGALPKDELEYYVAHRLNVAGYRGGRLFGRGALNALYRVSGGIPRLINILAHKAMLSAYGEGRHEVSPRHVRTAVIDTPAAKRDLMPWFWWLLTTSFIIGGGIGWMVLR
jgi:MSHA biogenesis protein MshM